MSAKGKILRENRRSARDSLIKEVSMIRKALKEGDKNKAYELVARNKEVCKRFGWYVRISKSGNYVNKYGF